MTHQEAVALSVRLLQMFAGLYVVVGYPTNPLQGTGVRLKCVVDDRHLTIWDPAEVEVSSASEETAR